jgi:membrane-associated phospholipid phosphatase
MKRLDFAGKTRKIPGRTNDQNCVKSSFSRSGRGPPDRCQAVMNTRDLWRRLVGKWRLKVALGSAMMAAYWLGYYLLERHPGAAVMPMPELALDRRLPFLPGMAWVYVSQFFLVPLIFGLLTTRRQLWWCCRGLALLVGVSFFCFHFWPTSVARPTLKPGLHFIYDWVAGADLPRNACPSLHAGFGIFTAGCASEILYGQRNRRWLLLVVWMWTAAILVSTLLIKQHVVLDLVAGGALGGISCWFMGCLPAAESRPEANDTPSEIKPAI